MRKEGTGLSDKQHWNRFFKNETQKCGERATAILSAAILDDAIGSLLKCTLLPCATNKDPLFDSAYAPLETFSAKVDLAVRMGLITAGVARSLHLIRKIRNEFAHNISGCSFNHASVRSRVWEITKLNGDATSEGRANFPEGTLGDFQTSVSWLIFWLWGLVEITPSRPPCFDGREVRVGHNEAEVDTDDAEAATETEP